MVIVVQRREHGIDDLRVPHRGYFCVLLPKGVTASAAVIGTDVDVKGDRGISCSKRPEEGHPFFFQQLQLLA